MIGSQNGNERYIQLDSHMVSSEVLLEICESVDVIACECPGYLARLLRQIQAFHSFTTSCIEQFPEAQETHEWLGDRAELLEQILSQTIIELMFKEGLIDENWQISLDKLSQRAREAALKQLG